MKTSESISKLAVALIGFHSEEISIKKDAKNPFYGNKYATLSGIIKAVKPALNLHKLSIIQLPVEGYKLETILLHESGEFISEVYDMKPTKQEPQMQGSAITYQRRYALGAILNLDIDDDDDGNQASQPERKEKQVPPAPPARHIDNNLPPASKLKIPEKAFSQLCDRLRANPDPLERGNLIAKTRRYYLPFDDEQENIISQITDNQ